MGIYSRKRKKSGFRGFILSLFILSIFLVLGYYFFYPNNLKTVLKENLSGKVVETQNEVELEKVIEINENEYFQSEIDIDLSNYRSNRVLFFEGANANAVKELVICGLLLSSRGIVQGNAYATTLNDLDDKELNKAVESQKKSFKGSELKGKTLGIVGLGAIGSLVAQAAEVLGMKIIGFDPHISIDAAWRLPKDVEKADSLDFDLAVNLIANTSLQESSTMLGIISSDFIFSFLSIGKILYKS